MDSNQPNSNRMLHVQVTPEIMALLHALEPSIRASLRARTAGKVTRSAVLREVLSTGLRELETRQSAGGDPGAEQ